MNWSLFYRVNAYSIMYQKLAVIRSMCPLLPFLTRSFFIRYSNPSLLYAEAFTLKIYRAYSLKLLLKAVPGSGPTARLTPVAQL